SMLEPLLESSSVNSNSLSESAVTFLPPLFAPSLVLETFADESSVNSKSTSESLSPSVGGAGFFLSAFSSERPLSFGSRKGLPLSPPPGRPLPVRSFSLGISPTATSSLLSVFSFNSKSSLSASRLSSNSLLSPAAGLGRLLPASDVSLPDDF